MIFFSRPIRRASLVALLCTLACLPFGPRVSGAFHNAPRTQNVIRFSSPLKPSTANGANGDSIAFDVTYDADDVPIRVDFQLALSTLVLSEEGGPLCGTGSRSSYSGDTENILPWPDPRPMYTFTGDVTPGGTFPKEVSITGLLGRSLDGQYIGPDRSEGSVRATYEVAIQGQSFDVDCYWTWDQAGEPGNGILALAKAAYAPGENAGPVAIKVLRTDSISGDVTVDYATESQSASAGQDFTESAGTLTFADGESEKTISIPILPDDLVEGEETFGLTLSNPTGGAILGSPTSATVTIDDTPDLAVLAYDLADFDLIQNGTTFTLKDVLIRVTNIFDENGETVPQATVEVRNGGTVIHSATVGPLAPGGAPQEITFDWDVTDLLVNGSGGASLNTSVVIDPSGTIPDRNPGNNLWPGGRTLDVLPVIESIQPQYDWGGNFFIQSVPVDNKIEVTINDWNGDAEGQGAAPLGTVYFTLNDDETAVPGEIGKTSHTYDMGSALTNANECAANLLLIHAVGAHPSFVTEPGPPLLATAVTLPQWVEWVKANLESYDLVFTPEAAGTTVNYGYNFQFPHPAFGPYADVPNWVPVLGGEQIGFIPPTVATLNTLSNSGGPGSVALNGTTGFTSPLLTASGDLYGTGETRFRCIDGFPVLDFDSVTFGFLLQNQTGSDTLKMEQIIPGIGTALAQIPYWGPELAANFNNSNVTVSATAGGGFEFTVSEQGEGALAFETARATAQLALTAGADLVLLDELYLSVNGGGTPYVTIKVPRPPPDFLEEVGIRLAFEAAYQIWAFSGSVNGGAACSLPGGCSLTQRLSGSQGDPRPGEGWQVIPGVEGGADYAVFVPERAAMSREIAADEDFFAGLPAGESIRATNVYTFPTPALAVDGKTVDGKGEALIVFVHADPADPPGRSTELASQTWNGANWQSQQVGSTAEQPDFNPAVAYQTVTGTITSETSIPAVLVWERAILPPDITPSLDITFTQSLEIMASSWDGSSWTEPVSLTSNSLMDRSPQLAAAQDGTILALWQTGNGESFGGTSANPVDLTASLWNGSTWTAPEVAVSDLVDVRQVRIAARSATEAAVVYTLSNKSTGDKSTGETDLYAATFDGTLWSAPQAVTANDAPDTYPALAYDSSGRRHLVWLEDGDVRWLVDSWTGSPSTPFDLDPGTIHDLALSAGPNGGMALTWQSSTSGQPGIGYSIYDPVAEQWSAPLLAVTDEAVESALSPALSSALAGDGNLHIAYAKAETTLITRTLTLTTGQTITVPNVSVRGQRDIAVLTIAPGIDLTWAEFSVDPPNPEAGQTVSVTGMLHNAGALSAVAPKVQIFDGPNLLATQTLADLGGGYTRTITAAITLGQQNGPHTLRAVVDPDGQISESDESNNESSLVTSLPDLEIDTLSVVHSSGGLTVTVTVGNSGVQSTASTFPVHLRADSPVTGSLLANGDGTVPAPGQPMTLTLVISEDALPDGNRLRLWVEVDPLDAIAEANEDDNRVSRPLDLLGDLAVDAEDISVEGGALSVVVHNRGVRTVAGGGTVWLRAGTSAPTAATAIHTVTLPAIPAGDQQTITFPVELGRTIFAVRIDGPNTIAEMNEANNMAFRRLNVVETLYLPSISRE